MSDRIVNKLLKSVKERSVSTIDLNLTFAKTIEILTAFENLSDI